MGLLHLLLLPFALAARGGALSCLWTWFAVPLGLPVLDIAQLVGLYLLLGCATLRTFPYADSEAEDRKSTSFRTTIALIQAFVAPAVWVSIGYVVYWYF